MYFRPLPILTIFTIPLLVILIMLGNWQWGRFQYKLISEANPKASILKLEDALKTPKEFQKVKLNGIPVSPLIAIETTVFGEYGKRYFGIINSNGKSIIYEYGFVSNKEEFKKPINIPQNLYINEIAIMRLGKKSNKYIPENQPPEKFYWPEIIAISKSLNMEIDENKYYLTPLEYNLTGANKRINPYADEKGATYVEPGRHLGYALTWWGLGISLIAVYVALHFTQKRIGIKRS